MTSSYDSFKEILEQLIKLKKCPRITCDTHCPLYYKTKPYIGLSFTPEFEYLQRYKTPGPKTRQEAAEEFARLFGKDKLFEGLL